MQNGVVVVEQNGILLHVLGAGAMKEEKASLNEIHHTLRRLFFAV